MNNTVTEECAWLFIGLPNGTWEWHRRRHQPARIKTSTGHLILSDAIADAERHGFHPGSEKYAVLSNGRTTYFHPRKHDPNGEPKETGIRETLRLFARIEPGVWRCIRAGEMVGPSGRIISVLEGSTFRSGQTYMDLDVATWLEKRMDKARPIVTVRPTGRVGNRGVSQWRKP